MLRFLILLALASGLVATGASARAVYRVRPGDTLSQIALSHGTTVVALEHLNGLKPTEPLLAGVTLKLAAAPAPTSPYVVREGDTLTALATRFHTSIAVIARASKIDAAKPILIGTTLRVPSTSEIQLGSAVATSFYRVRAGDTLTGIALHFGVSLGALADLNHLDLNGPLLAGASLILPAGAIETAPADYSRSDVRGSIAYWSKHYGVDPHLAAAVAWMESGFNNALVSNAGAVGVMQITPDTWDYVEHVLLLGQTVAHDPDGNVRIGVAYLHHLLHIFGGDPRKALAAYYQGARSFQSEGLLPGTQLYIDDILALRSRF